MTSSASFPRRFLDAAYRVLFAVLVLEVVTTSGIEIGKNMRRGKKSTMSPATEGQVTESTLNVLQMNLSWECMSMSPFGSGSIVSKYHCKPMKWQGGEAVPVQPGDSKATQEFSSCAYNTITMLRKTQEKTPLDIVSMQELCNPGPKSKWNAYDGMTNYQSVASFDNFKDTAPEPPQCDSFFFQQLAQIFPPTDYDFFVGTITKGPTSTMMTIAKKGLGFVMKTPNTGDKRSAKGTAEHGVYELLPAFSDAAGRPALCLHSETMKLVHINVHAPHWRWEGISDALKGTSTFGQVQGLTSASVPAAVGGGTKAAPAVGFVETLSDGFTDLTAENVDGVIVSGDFNDETGEFRVLRNLFGFEVGVDFATLKRTCCADRDPYWGIAEVAKNSADGKEEPDVAVVTEVDAATYIPSDFIAKKYDTVPQLATARPTTIHPFEDMYTKWKMFDDETGFDAWYETSKDVVMSAVKASPRGEGHTAYPFTSDMVLSSYKKKPEMFTLPEHLQTVAPGDAEWATFETTTNPTSDHSFIFAKVDITPELRVR